MECDCDCFKCRFGEGCERPNCFCEGLFVVVDWRPYFLPEVYGPFSSEEDADVYARKNFEVDTDDMELPDGIIVRKMTK